MSACAGTKIFFINSVISIVSREIRFETREFCDVAIDRFVAFTSDYFILSTLFFNISVFVQGFLRFFISRFLQDGKCVPKQFLAEIFSQLS